MFDAAIKELALKRVNAPTIQPVKKDSNALGAVGGIAGAILGGMSAGPAGALEGFQLGSTLGGAGDALLSGNTTGAANTAAKVATQEKDNPMLSQLFGGKKDGSLVDKAKKGFSLFDASM